jgi:hypothetical protein
MKKKRLSWEFSLAAPLNATRLSFPIPRLFDFFPIVSVIDLLNITCFLHEHWIVILPYFLLYIGIHLFHQIRRYFEGFIL